MVTFHGFERIDHVDLRGDQPVQGDHGRQQPDAVEGHLVGGSQAALQVLHAQGRQAAAMHLEDGQVDEHVALEGELGDADLGWQVLAVPEEYVLRIVEEHEPDSECGQGRRYTQAGEIGLDLFAPQGDGAFADDDVARPLRLRPTAGCQDDGEFRGAGHGTGIPVGLDDDPVAGLDQAHAARLGHGLCERRIEVRAGSRQGDAWHG